MFNGTDLVINAFVGRLDAEYRRNYGHFESSYGEILCWAGRMALERIAQSDALYHTVDHTIMVTLVGQEMLRGKHIRDGGVTPRDWLHFMISLLCHDIGYVRGVCRGDGDGGRCSTGVGDGMMSMPPEATDAYLSPYHVDRGMRFVRERFGGHPVIDCEEVAANIALTRFPVPESGDSVRSDDYRGLVRSADLVGQLADPDYLRKLPALFNEFQEIGMNQRLGYETWRDLLRAYPQFFWNGVHPYVADALSYLEVTQEGRQWRANLFAHVFATEHDNA